MEALILFSILLLSYFLPAIVASLRKHRQFLAIGMLNLLLGWSLLGWIIALVWACTADTIRDRDEPSSPKPPPAPPNTKIWDRRAWLRRGLAQ